MLSYLYGMMLKMLDEYDGSSASFSTIMDAAFDLSRQMSRGKPDFTSYVAEAVGVDPNFVGAWINGSMNPAKEDDRREVLDAVYDWFKNA